MEIRNIRGLEKNQINWYAVPGLDEEKLAGQKQIKALESLRNGKRRVLFDAQDEIDRRREQLIADIESRLAQKILPENLFMIQWKIV